MRRIKLTVEYDGSGFNGWQVQTRAIGEESGERLNGSVRTIQGELERALATLCKQPVRTVGAGRTDAGVHARGQVVSFGLPDEVTIPTADFPRALNGHLDGDVAVLSAVDVPLEFHAQRDATGKIYSYSIYNQTLRSPLLRRTHCHVRFPLDVERMRRGANYLVGTHDFTSFASNLTEIQERRVEDGKRELETVRTIRRIEWRVNPLDATILVMEIEGSGFLYQMVRTIAGTLIEVGRGFREPEWVGEALAAKDRRVAGPTALPYGLCLEKVFYEPVTST